MEGWNDFFLAEAGAAGVLTGLVFVSVSLNLDKILADPGSGLSGRAAEALILLVAVLTASSLLLLPGQGERAAGLEVLVVGAVAWFWVSAIQLRRLRNWGAMEPGLRQPFVLRMVLGQAATLLFVASAILLLGWGAGWLYLLAAGMIVSMLVALIGAWVLLVEINR